MFLGTPAGSKWAKQWHLDPKKTDSDCEVAEVASYAEWLALPADYRARRRYVLLSHHEDPITRFEPALIVQEPGWGRPRPARHLASGVLVSADYIRSHSGGREEPMSVTPGRFAARGHDYRADRARMVSAAYQRPVTGDELLAIERAYGGARPNGRGGAWLPSNCAVPKKRSSARPKPGAGQRTPPAPSPGPA